MKVSKAAKAVVATVGAVLVATTAAVGTAIEDGTFDTSDWIICGLAFLTAAGVYRVPNRHPEE